MDTNKSIIPFKFEDIDIRVINQDGEPWWVATDVCKALDLDDVRRAIERLDADEWSLAPVIDRLGRTQNTSIVNEPGLYTLILASRKPEAKTFKRWVTHEVIPAIRKTGSYTVSPLAGEWPDDIADDPRRLALAIKGERAKLTYLQTLKALRYPELVTRGRTSIRLLAGPPTPEHIQDEIIRHLTRLGELTLNTLYNSYMKRHDRQEVERNLAWLVEQGRVYPMTTSHSVKYFVPNKNVVA